MNAEEAMKFVMEHAPGFYRAYCIQILDLGDSFAFAFSPTKTDDEIVFGVTYDIIDKRTKVITAERFIDDPEKFLNAKSIRVE